ncbi:hypothetical protein SLA2020_380720 [Shorea laevis]
MGQDRIPRVQRWNLKVSQSTVHSKQCRIEEGRLDRSPSVLIYRTPGWHQNVSRPTKKLLVAGNEERHCTLCGAMSHLSASQGRTSETNGSLTTPTHS